MSFSIEADLLLAASDKGSGQHSKAREFLQSCIDGEEALYLTWPTLMAYQRIATHSGIFQDPLSPAEAAQNVDTLLALPHIRPLTEGENFWSHYQTYIREAALRGQWVTKAHVAAILRSHGVKRLYTQDKDYRRFDFLRVRNPLATA